jgi:hypothetical protein
LAATQSTTYRWDGATWTKLDAARGALVMAAAPGGKAVYAGDAGGGLRRIAPDAKDETASANLVSAWVHDDGDAYLVDATGDVRHFDGTTWSSIGKAVGASYQVGLGGTSDGSALLADMETMSGTVKVYDGKAWQTLPSPGLSFGVYAPILGGSSARDVWLGSGSTGIVVLDHFDGGAWKTVTVPTPQLGSSPTLTALHAARAGDVWVAGYASSSSAGVRATRRRGAPSASRSSSVLQLGTPASSRWSPPQRAWRRRAARRAPYEEAGVNNARLLAGAARREGKACGTTSSTNTRDARRASDPSETSRAGGDEGLRKPRAHVGRPVGAAGGGPVGRRKRRQRRPRHEER